MKLAVSDINAMLIALNEVANDCTYVANRVALVKRNVAFVAQMLHAAKADAEKEVAV